MRTPNILTQYHYIIVIFCTRLFIMNIALQYIGNLLEFFILNLNTRLSGLLVCNSDYSFKNIFYFLFLIFPVLFFYIVNFFCIIYNNNVFIIRGQKGK